MTLTLLAPAGELQPPPPPSAFEEQLVRARREWLDNEVVSVKQQRRAYQRAVADYRKTVMSGPMGPVTRARREQLLAELDAHTAALSDQSLIGLRNGITSAYSTGLSTAQPHLAWLADATQSAMPQTALVQVAQGYAETELATYLARTTASGLTLADSVWRATDPFHRGLTDLVQEAVVTGMSARDLAAQIDTRFAPINPTPSSLAVRRDLGLPVDVSYQATRLARTEVSVAGREGTLAAHRLSPFTEGFAWHRSRRPYPCERCDAWEAGSPYDADAVPPGHPNCRCYVAPVVTDRAQTMAELESWLANPTSQPHIEAWYQRMTTGGAALAQPPAGRPRPEAATTRAPGRRPATRAPLGRAHAAGVPPLPRPAGGWGDWSDVATAQRAATEQYPNIIFDFEGMDTESANAGMRGFKSIADAYPEVAAQLEYVGTYQSEVGKQWASSPDYANRWKTHEGVYAHASPDGKRVGLNPIWFGDNKKFNAELATGVTGRSPWHVPGSHSIEATVQHEMGHQVENWVTREGLAAPGPKAYLPVIDDEVGLVADGPHNIERFNRRTPPPSRYATHSEPELWAEGFTANVNAGVPQRIKGLAYVESQSNFLEVVGNDSSQWIGPRSATNPNGWVRLSDLPPGPAYDKAEADLAAMHRRLGDTATAYVEPRPTPLRPVAATTEAAIGTRGLAPAGVDFEAALAGVTPEPATGWTVRIGDEVYSSKQAVQVALGVDPRSITTYQANALLKKAGIEAAPPGVVPKAARAPRAPARPVVPPVAPQHVAPPPVAPPPRAAAPPPRPAAPPPRPAAPPRRAAPPPAAPPVRVAAPADLTPPRTFREVADAEDYLHSIGVNVKLGRNDIELGNTLSRGFYDHLKRGGRLPSSVSVISSSSNVIGEYHHSYDNIEFNRSHKYWRSPKMYAKEAFDSGFYASSKPTQVVTHELAHMEHKDFAPDLHDTNRRWTSRYDESIAASVGRYAAKTPNEFVAEVRTGMLSGHKYSTDVMNLYTRLGGPPK